jgi:hypothetical protein
LFNRFAAYRDKKVVGVFVRFRAPPTSAAVAEEKLFEGEKSVLEHLLAVDAR